MTLTRGSHHAATVKHDQVGNANWRDESNPSLRLLGWRVEQLPRRTLAKLLHSDRQMTYIAVEALVNAPELMVALAEADRAEVREMALKSVK